MDNGVSHCEACGREFGPYLVIRGHQPCQCLRGHRTARCDADTGGCGHVTYDPPLGERCRDVGFPKPVE